MNYAKELAKAALKIKAIKLNPDEPFKWASGYYMPIYNDNRKFLVFPEYRKLIVEAFASLIEKKGLKFDVIAGVATAGIPHAVSLSDKLDFPVVYVRNKQKAHGMQNQIEGAKDLTNKKVIVIEDLISTGSSAIKAVKAVREAGGEVVACLAIFSYGLETAKNNFAEINCPLLTLFNYDQLLEVAIEENYLTLNYLQTLEEWRKDPFKWGERFKEKINLTEKEQKARKRLCLPLDRLNSLEEVKARVKELSPYVGLFKVGKESFTKFGPEVVKLVQSYGSNVFLDLKYHDIPNTVKGAAKAVAELGVYMFNVHASGGLEMMKAAVEGVQEANAKRKPKIIGVTVLTSIDAETLNNELRISGQVEEQVLHLANLASEAKLDGIVCSAADLKSIKDQLPADFMYITPGVKGPNTEAGYDQKRVMTPGNAIQDGSSILVVGRAITNAEDRKKAALEVLQDMARVL